MRILIFVISIFCLVACGQSESKPAPKKPKVGNNKMKRPGKGTKTKKTGKARAINTTVQKDNVYWNKMKRQVTLNDDQIKKLKALDRKITRQIDDLKKKKKWDGPANKQARKAMFNKMERQQETIVGKSKMDALKKYQK